MSRRRGKFAALLAEGCFLSVAIACALLFVAVRLRANTAQQGAAKVAAPTKASQDEEVRNHVIGRLEIPALSLSVPVMENYDPSSLLAGVGHIKGTAQPGGLGNMGLAGHRDTYFRPLERISRNMEIRVVDSDGLFRYAVDDTEVVTPDKVEVLDIRKKPELTLITCFPFHFIGAAPKRFIVHAHLVSLSAEAS